MMRRSAQQPLAAFAVIGNTHSAALVDDQGSIEWCCLPHFDSPAVFCRVLDPEVGGYFRVGPAGKSESEREYVGESAVLATTFRASEGVLRLHDAMHAQDLAVSRLGIDDAECHEVLRLVECIGGSVEVEVACRPTFDYARSDATWSGRPQGAVAEGPGEWLAVAVEGAAPRVSADGTLRATLHLREGERRWVVLSHGTERPVPPAPKQIARADSRLTETLVHWRRWAAKTRYEGPFEDLVRGSLRVLKLLTFAPTGAIAAALTASLPEEIGGARNWDYRFTWMRDASLILSVLARQGHHVGAMDFFRWVENAGNQPDDRLQIMYRLDGGGDLAEEELPHLRGYRGSRPVRIGNAAADQTQLDVFGHVLDAALVCNAHMSMSFRPGFGRRLQQLADAAARRWREPDSGIWEFRTEPRQYLYSKLMCWVALDRAVRLAADGALSGDVARWSAEREAIRAAILQNGFNPEVGAFTQTLGGQDLDASALAIPLVGFLDAADPRVRATTDRIQEQLSTGGLVHRYRCPDGLPGGEGTFALCSFWLVANLADQDRLEEAHRLFARLASFASDLGLFAEEIDASSGELLGNYPQGFTHLALIRAATQLAAAERRAGLR